MWLLLWIVVPPAPDRIAVDKGEFSRSRCEWEAQFGQINTFRAKLTIRKEDEVFKGYLKWRQNPKCAFVRMHKEKRARFTHDLLWEEGKRANNVVAAAPAGGAIVLIDSSVLTSICPIRIDQLDPISMLHSWVPINESMVITRESQKHYEIWRFTFPDSEGLGPMAIAIDRKKAIPTKFLKYSSGQASSQKVIEEVTYYPSSIDDVDDIEFKEENPDYRFGAVKQRP